MNELDWIIYKYVDYVYIIQSMQLIQCEFEYATIFIVMMMMMIMMMLLS
jgi:hypothetical protein